METKEYKDITLTCRDCGKEFVWTAGEQEFYAEKGFTNPPARCKEDRAKRKAERNSNFNNQNRYAYRTEDR